MDKILIKKIKFLVNVELPNFSVEEKLSYYNSILQRLNKMLDNSNIDLDDFDELLDIKKQLMTKIYNTTNKME